MIKKIVAIVKKIPEEVRIRLISGTTMIYNFLNGGVKIFFAFFSVLGPAFISGLYSVCVGIGKNIYFKGIRRSGGIAKNEIVYFRAIGVTLVCASSLFILYMFLQVSLGEVPKRYGLLAIAVLVCVSVVELALAFFGISNAQRENDLLTEGLKHINLVSALNAVVTAESAMLVFLYGQQGVELSGYLGFLIGIVALVAGISILKRSYLPFFRLATFYFQK